MSTYACKYCGNETERPEDGCSCRVANLWIGVDRCFFVLNAGPVQCATCGTSADSVADLCHSSCYKAPGGDGRWNHIAAR